ncbi:MAG TPA: TonB-dependent receptor [Sphingobacteriaceae bacterium]|nr:TonB-dependent receptor [Sphingobacteriaceae bacterium]
MKKSTFICLLLLVCSSSIFAQNSSIKGLISDQQNKQPLEYASIALYKSTDSSLVAGSVNKENGEFELAKLRPGKYYLKIVFIGYDTRYVNNLQLTEGQKLNIGNVSLNPASKFLSEVTVTGQTATSYNKIDKQVYRADQFEAAKGGSAVDVLKNMPSISVNGEGDIRLRGSTGFLVLINGKPVQTDAATILSQLPANAIENVEIITAPSAKYDADGKAGIINIITKKGVGDGLSFVINAQGGLPSVNNFGNNEKPQRYGTDATLNYQKNKWDLSVGGSYQRNDIAGRRIGDVNTLLGSRFTVFPSVGERSFERTNYAARIASTFTPDKNNAINAGFYIGQRKQFRLADIVYNNTKTNINTGQKIGQINYFNSNLVKRQGDFALGNLDYTHTFANKSSLTVSGLYEYAKLDGFTKNRNLDVSDYSDTLQYVLNTGTSPLNGLRAKIDYAINIGKGKLESGYQLRYQKQTGSFLYQEALLGSGKFKTIPQFSDNIDVVNRINAIYSQYSGIAGKLEYVSGLRYEYANRIFKADKIAQPLELDLSNLFPSVNLLYTLPSGYKLKGGFSRRVQRSTNNELNPYAEREHSETLEQGDPQILPEFVSLTELGTIKPFKSGSLFATLYNQQITNVVNRVNNVFADSILNRIYTNAGKATLWGIETGLNLKPLKWWSAYMGGNVYDYQIKGSLFNNAVAVNNSGIAYSLNTNHNFQASKTLSFQFNLNYLSRRPTAQGEDSRFIIPNSSVKKSFLNSRLSATFQWQNMGLGFIDTNEQRITTSGSNFFTTTNYIQEKDILMLNISFNLNQLSKKVKLPASEFGEKEF